MQTLQLNGERGPQVGLVLEPGGEENKLVTGVSKGWVQFVDFRKMRDTVDGAAYEMGTWKNFNAVKTGSLSSISGHPHAPLIATGTTDQARLPTSFPFDHKPLQCASVLQA